MEAKSASRTLPNRSFCNMILLSDMCLLLLAWSWSLCSNEYSHWCPWSREHNNKVLPGQQSWPRPIYFDGTSCGPAIFHCGVFLWLGPSMSQWKNPLWRLSLSFSFTKSNRSICISIILFSEFPRIIKYMREIQMESNLFNGESKSWAQSRNFSWLFPNTFTNEPTASAAPVDLV